MTLAPSRSAGPRELNWRVMLPFGLVALAIFAVCAGLSFVLAQQIDFHLQQRQRAALTSVIGEFRIAFAEITHHRAGDVAEVHRSGRPTQTVLEGALVPSGAKRHRHDAAYLVDHEGRVLATFPPGSSALPPALERLLRGNGGARAPDGDVEADFVIIENQLAVAALARVRIAPATETSAGVPMALVGVALLGPRLVSVLEQASGIESLSFDSGPAQGGRESQPLLDRQGRIVGWIGWRGEEPLGVGWLAPLFGLVGFGLMGFALLAFRHACSTAHRLAANKADALKAAHGDPLTGLPNRRHIFEELGRRLADRPDGRHVCFAFLDLDSFKEVNESLGHRVGDQLLVYVAERLSAATAGSATLGRLGGDEFAMVMEADSVATAMQVANAAIASLARPFWLAGQSFHVGMSVGLAFAPQDGESRDDLTRRADLALRAAKRRTRGRAIAFELQMESELNDRRFVNRELRRALAEGGLDVHYQPIVAADGQRIVGVEALLRWRHPERGEIPPTVFVPVAEQTGLMLKLGEFVLRRALVDARPWKDVYIAVNLSPIQVRDRNLVDLVRSVLADTGTQPDRVVLEITEGVLIDNPEEAQARLESLRALGVKIALDDFGSGYSSLSYLRRFPIDKLKIDKEFVAPLGHSANGGVIIQAIMALGRALGLTVLCEGVETEEQRILLRLAGCDEMQGYLFARPGPAENIERLLSHATVRDAARIRRLGRVEA
jgi:diguanylate cyclase (GGDEF)-like protein